MEGTVLLHRASSTSCITLQSSFRGSLDRDYILAMKVDALSFALFAVLSLFGIADAGNNAGPPGTSAQHITYDCTADPMGCQNMCYYHYCLGRSNYLYIGTVALLRISAKTQQARMAARTRQARSSKETIAAAAATDTKSLIRLEGQYLGLKLSLSAIPLLTSIHLQQRWKVVLVRR